MTYNFYDTCSLLENIDNIFEREEIPVISSITLKELENIKTSFNKDSDIKYQARHALVVLEENSDKYEIAIFKTSMLSNIEDANLPIIDDTRILATAIDFADTHDDTMFYTNDLSLKSLAQLFFPKEKIASLHVENDGYTGYKEITMTEEEMCQFYELYQSENHYDCLINEYLIIRNTQGEVVDRRRWTGEYYKPLSYFDFSSKWFGKIKPLSDDVHQQLYADSLCNNKITMVNGPAGSGKSLLAVAYLFHLLERGKIDKIIIFCNTIATRGSAKLGYYPGTRDEKLLDSQIGNMLASKLGDQIEVERLICDNKLVLLPMSDIRGYDTSGMNAGIYITEAQNMDVDMMKLALQRIGDDNICILDGDFKTQVDLPLYEGSNNGMRRVSKVFRDHDIYGEITLQNVHRSKIGAIAENM